MSTSPRIAPKPGIRYRSERPPLRDVPRLDPRYLFTFFTMLTNRVLDRLPPARWWHRRSLGAIERTDLEIVLPGLGPAFDGLTLAFLSDLHVGSFMGPRELEPIFATVMETRPDVIAFGGDLVNSRPSEFELLDPVMPLLEAPLGMYAVPGNHEIFHGVMETEWSRFMERHGVEDLTNRGLRLERDGDSLWLAGVDDFDEGEPDLLAALAGRRPGEPTVLLSHHPDQFPSAAAHDVDVTLSGHTHGGQIRIFGRPALAHSEEGFDAGHYERDGGRLYVSRGVGVTFLPVRWACPAEWIVLRLRSDGSS